MQKLTLRDLKGPALYVPIREDFRRHIIAERRVRRVALGPSVALTFENRHTVMFQIEEMLRVEHITEPARMQEELDIYNPLIPGPHELSATLFVEITEQAEIRPMLNRLVGIDEHLSLRLGRERVPGRFEDGRSEADRISAVQYVRFPLTPAQVAALGAPQPPITLVIDHPGYQAETVLAPEVRAALAHDLATP
jgi:hypothetical protein